MKVLFENSQGKTREIANVSTIEEVNKVINNFCEERSFHIRYKRKWKKGNVVYVDVGSHTEFFHIVEDA